MDIDSVHQIWLVQFVYERMPGEAPRPVMLTAKECRSGQTLALGEEKPFPSAPPYALGPDTLFVAYDAPAALGCHLSLGWPMPSRVLDLHAEFRWLNSGRLPPGDYGLGDALNRLGLDGTVGKGLERLFRAMQPRLDLPRALLRGRYTAAVACMEAVGVPIDVEALQSLRARWPVLLNNLIERVDSRYGVFRAGKLNPLLWAAWLNRHGIPWPRKGSGRLDLSLDTFREMAYAYPEVGPMKELQATLALLRPAELAVGRDGRNRCPLRPFAAKTGRNAPSTTQFIFGPATWLRGLIRPQEGMALAYIDYGQQEFGIAAALSKDEAMMAAYRSGDPYLAFARQAGAVPADATKDSHREVREQFKHCALGVQYGMGARSLATRLNIPRREAQQLLRLHRQTYPTYWRWSDAVERHAFKKGSLEATFGWRLLVGPDANPRSVRNFPLQANGAEMLRLACCYLTETGVRVCAPVHDALLVEGPANEIEGVVAECERAMTQASKVVLPGFPLRTEAKVVRHPARYMDQRGRAMWGKVFGLARAA